MASLSASGALLCLLLSFHILILSSPAVSDAQFRQGRHLTRKLQLLEEEDDEEQPPPTPPKKKISSPSTASASSKVIQEGRNQTKIPKPTTPKKSNSTTAVGSALLPPSKSGGSGLNKTLASGKLPNFSNSTKLLKSSNSTKLLKPSDSTKLLKPSNSTKLPKASDSTKLPKVSSSTKILKLTKAENATTAPKVLKSPKTVNLTASVAGSKNLSDLPSVKTNKSQSANPKPKQQQQQQQQQQQKSTKQRAKRETPWYETAFEDPTEEESDIIAEFRDLPSKFHQTILPDLEKFSTTSKVYLSRANKQITRGVKPIVGNRYAPTVASVTSALFLVLPLLLVAALLHQVRTYLSLPRILLFVHAYLAIYFSILSLTAVLTGLEPLRLFYATSPGPYVYTQVLQTLGYVLYLLLQLMHLIVAFATTTSSSAAPEGAATRALALGQLVVGLAVGLHYYTAVFHRAVVGEPPRTNWRVHGLYAACFISICAFTRAADRRKKAYLLGGPGSDVSKKS